MTSTAVQITLLAAVAVLVLVAMAWGWRRRVRRTTALVPALAPAPADLGELRLGPLDGTYVSTALAADLFDRVAAHRLGRLSPVVVEVHDAGVVLRRPDAPDVFVPAAAVRGAERVAGMAGKTLGGEGIVLLRWQPEDGPELATGLRTGRADREPLTQALRSLTVTPSRSTEEPA